MVKWFGNVCDLGHNSVKTIVQAAWLLGRPDFQAPRPPAKQKWMAAEG